jgi:hypothetical protein
MNKARILGVIIILTGLIINYITENRLPHFISGMIIGLGIGLVVIGKFNPFKK